MERILVAIDGEHPAWQALSHACLLAKRIDAQINVLLILPSMRTLQASVEKERHDAVRKRLAFHLEKAQTERITINVFLSEGQYEDEVIRFANHNKITLVMHEMKQGDMKPSIRESSFLKSLRLRITSKVEVVTPKKSDLKHFTRIT